MQQSSPIEHPVRRCPIREEEVELLRLGWRNCQRGLFDGKARRDFIAHLLGQALNWTRCLLLLSWLLKWVGELFHVSR
jgi:hypothetical protein